MDQKTKLGQFYTKNAHHIIGNLVPDLPIGQIVIIDPFAGEGDLRDEILKQRNAPTHFRLYDIDPKGAGVERRDSLLNPVDYRGLWVVTNPPYRARNKSADKTAYDKWGVSDLYKACVKSIMGCEGGILVVPLNFFCDEKDIDVRGEFLSRFTIMKLNVFEERVFEDTDYAVCSFSFKKGGREKTTLRPRFYPCNGDAHHAHGFPIERKYSYQIGGSKLHEKLQRHQCKVKISRLVESTPATMYKSNLHLRATDTGTNGGKIKLERIENLHCGNAGDKTFAALAFDVALTREQEVKIVDGFNTMLSKDRATYHSLFLTNYRTGKRKRMTFGLAYKYISYILKTALGFA